LTLASFSSALAKPKSSKMFPELIVYSVIIIYPLFGIYCCSLAISCAFFRRSLIKSIFCFGVLIPDFDFFLKAWRIKITLLSLRA
jgi:hypothetical protein